MYCTKCGKSLDSGLNCWHCGTQYQLVEKTNTAEFIPSSIMNPKKFTFGDGKDYYNLEKEYIQWEY